MLCGIQVERPIVVAFMLDVLSNVSLLRSKSPRSKSPRRRHFGHAHLCPIVRPGCHCSMPHRRSGCASTAMHLPFWHDALECGRENQPESVYAKATEFMQVEFRDALPAPGSRRLLRRSRRAVVAEPGTHLHPRQMKPVTSSSGTSPFSVTRFMREISKLGRREIS